MKVEMAKLQTKTIELKPSQEFFFKKSLYIRHHQYNKHTEDRIVTVSPLPFNAFLGVLAIEIMQDKDINSIYILKEEVKLSISYFENTKD